MTTASKRKGDNAEREAVAALASVGIVAERNYGAGRPEDVGDLSAGSVVFQVKDLADFGRACMDTATDASTQRVVAGAAAGVGLARRRGGKWVATMTLAELAWLLHAARVTP